ncbi:hypothetical protein L7F22_068622 [Adiantum nelumboides]|nr:hypothetical protein [Adiantum nelumboides]
MENSNDHMMQQMMQQFAAFFQQQQVMQQRMNLEDRMRKARQCVIEKLDLFDGRDISKFCRAYEEAKEDNGIDDSVAIENFHLIVKSELRGPIEELQGQHSVSWRNFKVALKAEYFLEDSQRETKQTFIKWVQMKNKGLTSRELLREFEKKFDHLSMGEQQSLRSEKVELFVQAADSHLQKSLVQLLEDLTGEFGLTNDWDAVPAAINLLVKRQKRIDKSIVVDSHEDFEENGIVEKIVEKPKASSSPTLEGQEKPKAAQSSTLDDLIKVDSLSVYAYIAKAQANEAFVEDKRKREDEAPETSKRQTRANTRSDGERMQKSTPISEVQMKDASKDKKQSKVRGPSNKLRSDIELAINLKKVFEERILNSKVEMTLGDILGIAKREFHEEIIDIIKRKRHVPVEQETNPINSQNILHEELEDLEEPRARMENDVLSTRQRDYPQVKRELWGVVTALKCDKEYFIGASVMVETDCLPLIGMIANCSTPDIAMLRWIAFIKSLNPKFSHIAGRDNPVADMLSRARFEDEDEMVMSSDDVGLKFFTSSNLQTNCGFQAHVFEAFLAGMYEGEFIKIVRYLSTLTKSEDWSDQEYKKIRKKAYGFFLKKGHLWRHPKKQGDTPKRIIGDLATQQQIIKDLHESLWAGHRGVWATSPR